MLYLSLFATIAAILASAYAEPKGEDDSAEPVLSLKNQAQVFEHINQKQSLWKAGRNFPDDVSEGYLKRLASAYLPNKENLGPAPKYELHDDYPENFDARQKWPKCPSIAKIWDQGNCGSCWAVAAASVITDRTCIASDGKFTGQISAQEIVSCCKKCGYGCQGGWPDKAFEFYTKHGVVTGGDYNSKEGCMPYEIKPCSHHTDGKYPSCSSYNTTETPECSTKCSNSNYKVPRRKDRHFGTGRYTVCRHGAKYQLFNFGPITQGFVVYEDFYHYKSGVYTHTWGKKMGYHIVKLLGWGKENGVDYWLAANSWNSDWGDKGVFKIRAGVDECNNEEYFSLTEPKLKSHYH